MRPGISVVMAAHNEAAFIGACLESVRDLADDIVVVDGGSDDDTVAIARSYGARVIGTTNKLMLNVNKNLAIDAAECEWVLVLDPDERVTADLADELRSIAAGGSGFQGFWIQRRDRELGRWLRHGSLQLRFFRNRAARFPCRHIHEMVQLEGEAGRLHGVLAHEPRQSLFEYVHKRNLYSEHRARFLHESGARFRASRLLLRPPVAFAKSYLARGGWRDGLAGLVIAVTAAYGTFLQDAKLWQLEHEARS